MALASDGDAYAVPLFFAYDGDMLYFHSHPGEKDTFLEGTHEGSFVVVEVHGVDQWTSVQVTGAVQKLDHTGDAEKAFQALSEVPLPPEFGFDQKGRPNRSWRGSYFWMMAPRKITGRTSRSVVRAKGPGGQ